MYFAPSFTNKKYKIINHVHKNMSVWSNEETLVDEMMVRR